MFTCLYCLINFFSKTLILSKVSYFIIYALQHLVSKWWRFGRVLLKTKGLIFCISLLNLPFNYDRLRWIINQKVEALIYPSLNLTTYIQQTTLPWKLASNKFLMSCCMHVGRMRVFVSPWNYKWFVSKRLLRYTGCPKKNVH